MLARRVQTDIVMCNFAVCFIRKKDENYLKILSLGGFLLFCKVVMMKSY